MPTTRALLLVLRLSTGAALAAITAANAEEIHPPHRILSGHAGSVVSVQLTADSKTLVSGSRDDTIRVWDLATGQVKRTLRAHKGDADIYALAFSPDGKLMASGGRDTTIILWNAETFEPIRTLRGHTGDIRDVTFSPDGRTLASAAEDNTFRLWDVATGALKVTRREHTAKVKSVGYMPDARTIVTGSSDSTVRLWDAVTGEPEQVLRGAKDGFEFCAISPDGRQLFAGTGNIGELIFWDAHTGKVLRDLPEAHGNQFGAEVDSGTYTRDGRIAISGSKDRTIKFWDTRTFQLLHVITGLPGRIESMDLAADDKTLVTGFGGTDFRIMVWDLSQVLK